MKTPGHATVDRSGYDAYIRSAAWRRVRQRYIASKLPKVCAGCKSPWGKGDHLHHRTYKNLGNERLMDLVPLCQSCHIKVHALYDGDPKWRRKGLWYATRAALKPPKVCRPHPRRSVDERMGVVKSRHVSRCGPRTSSPV